MHLPPPLLSICIPTFNRAEKLRKQLKWFVMASKFQEADLELVICDNASPDHTAEVYREAATQLNCRHHYHRNERNMGAEFNFFKCVEESSGRYVWLMGDDDLIDGDAIKRVSAICAAYPEVAAIHLNHRAVDGLTGKLLTPSMYGDTHSRAFADGNDMVAWLLERSEGGTIFIGASICERTVLCAEIQRLPPHIRRNMAICLILMAITAANRRSYYLGEPALTSVYNVSGWVRESYRVYFHDMIEATLHLLQHGLSHLVAKEMIRRKYSRPCIKQQAIAVLKRPWHNGAYCWKTTSMVIGACRKLRNHQRLG